MAVPNGIQVAFDLAETAALMVEATYRRKHPDASDDEVAEHVRRWWGERPGAVHGDAPGRPRSLDQ